jgi:two-component system, NarL family, response regulator
MLEPDEHPATARTPAPIRVLLVDDHAIMREGLAAVLEASEGFSVVGQAGDGRTAVRLFDELRPDVAIVDLRMHPIDGVDTTIAIRARDADAHVMLLTASDTDEDVSRAMRAGATGYLLKDVDIPTLLDAIRAVHAGRRVLAPGLGMRLAEHLATSPLTPRQQQALDLLATGNSNAEIASALGVCEGTAKTHVKAILAKLHARDRTQALSIALRRGLVRLP